MATDAYDVLKVWGKSVSLCEYLEPTYSYFFCILDYYSYKLNIINHAMTTFVTIHKLRHDIE
jgi:hypothetical protein